MSLSPLQSSVSQTQPLATTQTGNTSSADATGSAAMNATNLGGTFLQLLTKELQNQDPTAPMDSTQMVGQMISLNQLAQLASINQTLTKNASATSAATAKATGLA